MTFEALAKVTNGDLYSLAGQPSLRSDTMAFAAQKRSVCQLNESKLPKNTWRYPSDVVDTSGQ